jgi:hypothetical protein
MIVKKGAWFTIVDTESGEVISEGLQGVARVYEFLEDEANEDILSKIEDFIDKKISEN